MFLRPKEIIHHKFRCKWHFHFPPMCMRKRLPLKVIFKTVFRSCDTIVKKLRKFRNRFLRPKEIIYHKFRCKWHFHFPPMCMRKRLPLKVICKTVFRSCDTIVKKLRKFRNRFLRPKEIIHHKFRCTWHFHFPPMCMRKRLPLKVIFKTVFRSCDTIVKKLRKFRNRFLRPKEIIYHKFRCKWRFPPSSNVHAQRLTAQKVFLKGLKKVLMQ